MNVGDYIHGTTSGGISFNGTIHSIFNNGECSVIPDGGKTSIPFHQDQICDIIKPIKRGTPEPKGLDRGQIERAIDEMIVAGSHMIDLPGVFSSMCEYSLLVREKNTAAVVSVLLGHETKGRLKRHNNYNGIAWTPYEGDHGIQFESV